MITPLTLLYASLNGLLYFILSMWVVKARFQHRVEIGHGENGNLLRVIRVHANAAEYIPLVLFFLLILEINHTSTLVLNFIGAGLLLGRILHAFGLYGQKGPNPARFLGTVLTWLALLTGAIASFIQFTKNL